MFFADVLYKIIKTLLKECSKVKHLTELYDQSYLPYLSKLNVLYFPNSTLTPLTQKVIKPKLGLLELAKQLGNVSQACKVMG
jgi:hypothetical protein